MNLSGLLCLLADRRTYESLVRTLRVSSGERAGVSAAAANRREARLSPLEPAKPYFLAGLQHDLNQPMLVVVASENRARDLAHAVELAAGLAEPGGVVLLSPGYKSYDWFTSFEDRGRRFKDSVRAWNKARAC